MVFTQYRHLLKGKSVICFTCASSVFARAMYRVITRAFLLLLDLFQFFRLALVSQVQVLVVLPRQRRANGLPPHVRVPVLVEHTLPPMQHDPVAVLVLPLLT